jgi:hypothetical protein
VYSNSSVLLSPFTRLTLVSMPSGPGETIRVSFFMGGPGTNFDLLTLSFQVPTKGSVWASTEPATDKTMIRTVAIETNRFIVISFLQTYFKI